MQYERSDPVSRRAMEVIHHVQQLIEDGSLKPGSKLPTEREFAKQLNISRGSVRVGIGYLVGMGITDVRRGVGTFLAVGAPKRKSSPLQLFGAIHHCSRAQMLEARSIVEGEAVALAAEHSKETQFRDIAEELAAIYATVDSPEEFLTHELCLHRLIVEASGNPVLVASLDMITTVVVSNFPATMQTSRQRWVVANIHREIYKAIRQHRPDDARRWMESLFSVKE